jgi:hypothetical protein
MVKVTVREASRFGVCNVLGTFVRETKTRYVYRRYENGPTCFVCKRRPSIHLEPCKVCLDY